MPALETIVSAQDATLQTAAATSRMRNLIRRLGSSSLLIGLTLGTIFWFPLWVYAVVVCGFVGIALYEFFTMVRHRGILVHRPLSVGLGVVFASLVAWRALIEPGFVHFADHVGFARLAAQALTSRPAGARRGNAAAAARRRRP